MYNNGIQKKFEGDTKMKKLLTLVLALILVLGCFSAALADNLSDIQEKGTLVVGANVLFPPYEFYYTNPETGEEEYAGFDMALAKGVADLLGVELVIADQDFAGLVTALSVGELDMVISGIAIRDDRKEVVDFSDPYYNGTQIMMVRAEDFDTLKAVEDLSGKNVGAQTGSLQAGILEEQFADSNAFLNDKIPLMVLDLMNGDLDGLLLTDTVAKQYMAVYPDKFVISDVPVVYDNTAGVGIAVQKGDNETLLALLNDYIAQIKADGTFDAWEQEAMTKSANLVETAD